MSNSLQAFVHTLRFEAQDTISVELRPVDGGAEATVGFRQVLGAVVQVGEVRDADHAVLPREASCISLSILSR